MFAMLLLALITVNDIDSAIMHILTKGVDQKHSIVLPRPKHPLVKDNEKRNELSTAIAHAASKYKIDPYLLIAIAFRERSFFEKGKDGALKERSTFQITPSTEIAIQKIEPECNTSTYYNSALCCAAWLNYWKHRCNNGIKGAIGIYATGKSCNPKNTRSRWVVEDRLRLAKTLKSTIERTSK